MSRTAALWPTRTQVTTPKVTGYRIVSKSETQGHTNPFCVWRDGGVGLSNGGVRDGGGVHFFLRDGDGVRLVSRLFLARR